MTELHYLDILDLSELIRARNITVVDLVNAQLERIAQLDPRLHAFVLLTGDLARQRARESDAEIRSGIWRGPLHGVPVAIKDLFWVKALPTRAGITIEPDAPATEDATVVCRLEDAGAIVLGKVQLTEGAFSDHHAEVDPPLNAWNAAHWPGVSSSGSGVATAAGLCFAALGTDTGGSIRFPCAANGLTGIKPTWGRVSRHGTVALAPSLDHVGPIARTARDAAAMLAVIAGPDPKDPTTTLDDVADYVNACQHGVARMRIGVDRTWNSEEADEELIAAEQDFQNVMRALGAEVVEIRMPDPRAVIADWEFHCGVETAVEHETTYPMLRYRYGPALTRVIEMGRNLSGCDYQRIAMRRREFRGLLDRLFTNIDLLLVPVQPFAAPTSERMDVLGRTRDLNNALIRFTTPFNMSGHPTITLPCARTTAGLPLAVQLVARRSGEATLCAAGAAYQNATSWHRLHPDL